MTLPEPIRNAALVKAAGLVLDSAAAMTQGTRVDQLVAGRRGAALKRVDAVEFEGYGK